jgi:hypothetical protein
MIGLYFIRLSTTAPVICWIIGEGEKTQIFFPLWNNLKVTNRGWTSYQRFVSKVARKLSSSSVLSWASVFACPCGICNSELEKDYSVSWTVSVVWFSSSNFKIRHFTLNSQNRSNYFPVLVWSGFEDGFIFISKKMINKISLI